jgi:hypothetical protein
MMNSPSKTALVLTLVLCSWKPLLLAADAPHNPLWRKAVAAATANADWVPGLVITRIELFHRGKSISVREEWLRSKPGPKGEVVKTMVKILNDGKDVTQQEKTKSKENSGPKNTDGEGSGNPFDADFQDRLTLKVTGQSRVIAGRDCTGFAFELRITHGPVASGTAWVERATGAPSEIENMTLNPLPNKHLRSMALTTRYDTATNGVCLVKTIEGTMTASMFSIKVDSRSMMTFSEYWKKPQPETTLGKGRE